MNLTNPPPDCAQMPLMLSGGRTAVGRSLLWGAITGAGQFWGQGCFPKRGWMKQRRTLSPTRASQRVHHPLLPMLPAPQT